MRPDDFRSTTEGAGTNGLVAVGTTGATGTINYATDQDLFGVTLAAGTQYFVDLEGAPTGQGTIADPYISAVYAPGGAPVPGLSNGVSPDGRPFAIACNAMTGPDVIMWGPSVMERADQGEPPMTRASMLAAACLAIPLAALAQPAWAQDSDPTPIVEIMRAFAGPGTHRPSGAKGACYAGRFEPTAAAPGLSKAVIFARPSEAVIRFSVGGGNPGVADGARGVNRGLSFRIDADGAGQTEFVMVNAPINFVATPAQMLGFLEARKPAANGQPDPARVRAFSEANPETLLQARYLASQPIPGSWVGVNYWAVHAYTLTNAAGARQVIKFRMDPLDGPVNLTDDEARAKSRDFLAADIGTRLASGRPTGFRMVAIPGRAGDPTDNVTKMWEGEDTRPVVELGRLLVRSVADAKICDETIFAPTILADGIDGPENDPMFAIRTPAYAISITKRAN